MYIRVLGISNLPISTIFLLNFWNFSDDVILFFHFIIGCEKRIMMMYLQQGLQEKFCKAEQYCFGVWEQAETSLKTVDLSWKYQKNNEKIKIKRQWLRLWGPSEIHGPFRGFPGPVPMYRLNPPLICPAFYHPRLCKSSSLSFYGYNIMCFVKHASSKRYCWGVI